MNAGSVPTRYLNYVNIVKLVYFFLNKWLFTNYDNFQTIPSTY